MLTELSNVSMCIKNHGVSGVRQPPVAAFRLLGSLCSLYAHCPVSSLAPFAHSFHVNWLIPPIPEKDSVALRRFSPPPTPPESSTLSLTLALHVRVYFFVTFRFYFDLSTFLPIFRHADRIHAVVHQFLKQFVGLFYVNEFLFVIFCLYI